MSKPSIDRFIAPPGSLGFKPGPTVLPVEDITPKASKAALPYTEDIEVLVADLRDRLTEAFLSYLSASPRGGRAFINDAKIAVAENVPAAFYSGFEYAGAEETEDEDEDWITAKQSEQMAFLDNTFAALKEDREEESATEEQVDRRVDAWVETLKGIYSEGILRGGKNMMCYLGGEDGEESCQTCQDLKDGPNRSMKWIRDNNMIPAPGNENYECKGYRCKHNWFTVKDDAQVTF